MYFFNKYMCMFYVLIDYKLIGDGLEQIVLFKIMDKIVIFFYIFIKNMILLKLLFFNENRKKFKW